MPATPILHPELRQPGQPLPVCNFVSHCMTVRSLLHASGQTLSLIVYELLQHGLL